MTDRLVFEEFSASPAVEERKVEVGKKVEDHFSRTAENIIHGSVNTVSVLRIERGILAKFADVSTALIYDAEAEKELVKILTKLLGDVAMKSYMIGLREGYNIDDDSVGDQDTDLLIDKDSKSDTEETRQTNVDKGENND